MAVALTDIAREFISRGVILQSDDGDAVKSLTSEQQDELYATLKQLPESDFVRVKGDVARFVKLFRKLDRDTFFALKAQLASEHGKAFFEDFIGHYERVEPPRTKDWEISWQYEEFEKKRTYDDFVQLFRSRHKQLSSILSGRYELQNALPARRIMEKENRESVAFIGVVREIRETKNSNYVITAEDSTGVLTLIAHTSKPQVIEAARDIVPDEVLGFRGTRSSDAVFIDDVIWPDIPVDQQMRYASDDVGAVFISDVQYGRQFLHHEFDLFCDWIAGESEEVRA